MKSILSKSYLILLISLIISIVLIISEKHIGIDPVFGILLMAISYILVVTSDISTGETSVPPQTVRKYDKPRVFWIVITVHVLMTLTVIVGVMSYLLSKY